MKTGMLKDISIYQILFVAFCIGCGYINTMGQVRDEKTVFPGADENMPSRSEYFSWINNTNEGPAQAQTLINLEFFKRIKIIPITFL